jgi:MFS family permease
MNRRVSHLIAGWRTGLSRPVLILQAGNALNYFGYGLVLPFEIIYLHQIRGFSTSTAGLVLAATMGTAAIATPPTGALLDRYSAKAIVVAGSLASAVGYAGFAYVDRPWQAFACSIVSGAGLGAAGTANRVLIITLVKPEPSGRMRKWAMYSSSVGYSRPGRCPICCKRSAASSEYTGLESQTIRAPTS